MSKDLKVHVGEGFETVARRVADAWRRAERGVEIKEDHITFVSWRALAQVMTPRRLDLLRHLHRHPAPSIAALARSLKRDYKRVHEDVEALVAAGLIERDAAGLRVDYREMRTVIAL